MILRKLPDRFAQRWTGPQRPACGDRDTDPRPDDLLTPEEVAAELRVSVQTVHRMLSGGKLPYVAVGTGSLRPRRRVRRDSLDTFKRGETVELSATTGYCPPGRWV